jgi:hypothetical protein
MNKVRKFIELFQSLLEGDAEPPEIPKSGWEPQYEMPTASESLKVLTDH